MLRHFQVSICLLLLAFALGTSQAQEPALISPGVFLRGLELASGVRYTASFIKPTDDTVMRNLSVEITLPADAQFTEMLVSRQVEFDVIRRNRQGQLTLIWQISRVAAEAPLDAFSFTLAAPLDAELEFYTQWQDEQGQTSVENFFELPSTTRADATEVSITPGSADFAFAGNSGIQVSSNSTNPLNFHVLANSFNPPAEYGRIWWCSLVELSGLDAGSSAMLIVPLRRPVAPFTELVLFQQQADGSWLALEEKGIVTADGQFVMYRHFGGLMATGGDEEIQQEVVSVEQAVIEPAPPQENQEPAPQPQNNEPAPPAPVEKDEVVSVEQAVIEPAPPQENQEPAPQPQNDEPAPLAPVEKDTVGQVEPIPVLPENPVETDNNDQDNPPQNSQIVIAPTSQPNDPIPATVAPVPAQTGGISDGASNTIILGEATVTPVPAQTGGISDGASNTIILGEATFTPVPAQTGGISDGASNTIILGEATFTPVPAQTGGISDGASNTIILGEATFTPVPAQTGGISDGASNTITLGEATFTPTADGIAHRTPPVSDETSQAEKRSPTPVVVAAPKEVIITPPPAFGAGGARILILKSNDGKLVQCQVGGLLCVGLQRRAGKGLR